MANFRAFARELEEHAAKEKTSLVAAHEAEIAKIKEQSTQDAEEIKSKAVQDGLRVVIHFLHTAASKRQVEEAESDEARAFEGALLLVYQGNETALSTLKNLINGTDEKVMDVQGEPLDFTFAQVKESSMQSAQDLVSQPPPAADHEATAPVDVAVDKTIANAGLTELDDTTAIQTNATAPQEADAAVVSAPEQISTDDQAANAVAEGWDPQASIVTDASITNEEWVQVPRDPAETDNGVTATPAALQTSSSWAEEVGAAATPGEDKPVAENDGFEQVRRERGGRGGRGGARGGRGEFRGRGRGGREGYRGGGPGRGNRDGQGGKGGRGGGGPRAEKENKS